MATMPTKSHHEAVCEWLTANGISPKQIPRHGDLTIQTNNDGTRVIAYEAFVLTEDGRLQVDERNERPLVEKRTTPLVVEPPERWEPYEKPTRDHLMTVLDGVQKATEQTAPGGDGVAGEYEFGWDAAMAAVKKALREGGWAASA